MGREEALALAKTYDKVIAARGKQIVSFDLQKDLPDDDTLAAHILGPTGNLRAPALKKGRTLLVGFTDVMYRRMLAG